MFILKQSILSQEPIIAGSSGLNRHYRGRNLVEVDVLPWGGVERIPEDLPDIVDMCFRGIRSGGEAVKQSLKPACFVWSLMAGIAALYYMVPTSRGVFLSLEDLQLQLGLLFPFLAMGLSVGLLSEGVKVIMSGRMRWTKANSINTLFNLIIFGILGVLQNYLYQAQAWMFGEGNGIEVLFPKVLFDQFVWTVFFANPYQTILYLWKNNGFSWSAVISQMFPFKAFWGMQVLPVLVTNWFFWIPMVSIIYCFPSSLQLPLAILAVTIWVLLLSILTSKKSES